MKPLFRRRPPRPRVLWRGWILPAGFAAASVWASGLGGAGFRLEGLPSGAGTSTGGSYSLAGWVAPAGGSASRGGGFEVAGGFAPVQVVSSPDLPLTVKFTSDKLAELRWPPGLEGYILEFSPRVGPGADWQPTVPQPTSNGFVTPCQQPARYFRLRKP